MSRYNTKGKNSLNNRLLNNEGQECRTGHARERGTNGKGRVNEKAKKVKKVYFLYTYECGTFRPGEITTRRGLR
jgi:hypothetical protein